MAKEMRYSDRNKTQTGTSQRDRGFINEKSKLVANSQPRYGSGLDPKSSKSKNGVPRNPKQKNSGPMKSSPFPGNY